MSRLNEEIENILSEADSPTESANSAGGESKAETLVTDDPAAKTDEAPTDKEGESLPMTTTSKAPSRKGDKVNSEDDPVDPPTGVKSVVDEVDPHNGLPISESKDEDDDEDDDDDLDESKLDNFGGKKAKPFTKEDGKKTKKEEKDDEDDDIKESFASLDLEEDIAALTSGHADLSEDFKVKAKMMIEAATRVKLEEAYETLKERMEYRYEVKLNEAKAEHEEYLEEKLDSYTNYVADEFMKENKLAVDHGIKNDMTESFIEGLKTLFAEHYVEIPEDKQDIVGELSEKLEETQTDLSEAIDQINALKSNLKDKTKSEIIEECVEGLSDTRADKIRALSEQVAFDSEDSYRDKVETIVESYASVKQADSANATGVLTEDVETNSLNDQPADMSDPMARYAATLGAVATRPKQV